MRVKRRTDAEIREVQAIHDRTSDVAREIDARVNTDETHPSYAGLVIRAADYWTLKPAYQREIADTLIVRFSSKDPAVIERVALAIKAALTVEEA